MRRPPPPRLCSNLRGQPTQRPPHSAGPLKIVAHGGQYGGGGFGIRGPAGGIGPPGYGYAIAPVPKSTMPAGENVQSWQTLQSQFAPVTSWALSPGHQRLHVCPVGQSPPAYGGEACAIPAARPSPARP